MSLAQVLQYLDTHEEEALKRLFALMAVESISTDPVYKESCQAAAELSGSYLKEIGFKVEVMTTTGHPMVLGKYRSKTCPQAPHILFYGHYDVQPVDPIEEWAGSPFEPQIVEDAINGSVIFGRGASDDKGQLMTFFEALRAWLNVSGDLPLNITVLLEGEEESGSPSLPAFLVDRGDDLKADFALICDTLQWDKDTPAITTMLRGLASLEVTVEGPNRDLHSGMYGGPALNPIKALTMALSSLYDENGNVVLRGFYDDVKPPDPRMIEKWKSLDFQEAEFLGDIGLSKTHGEPDKHLLEQLWSRPTLEINGIWGGYTGAGFKTVIPSKAHAKLSFRLVDGQSPGKVIKALEVHLQDHLPLDAKLSLSAGDGSPAVAFDLSKPFMKPASDALSEEFNKEPVMLGCGGSIPIVEAFYSQLDMDCLLIGFALNDDCIHAPNEKYNLSSFKKGTRVFARMIEGFSKL